MLELDVNFNNMNSEEKINYLQKIITKKTKIENLINSLIKNGNNIIETIKLINDLSKKRKFKTIYKVKNIDLISIIINQLIILNKNKELSIYLDKMEQDILKMVISNEIKNRTTFSKTKLCKNLNKKLNITLTEIRVKKNLNEEVKKINLNKKITNKKVKIGISSIIFIIVLAVGYILVGYSYYIINFYNSHVYPNTYLDGKLIEGDSYQDINKYLDNLNGKLKDKVDFINSNDTYSFTYDEIGITSNIDELKKELIKNNKLNGFDKMFTILKNEDIRLKVEYFFDEDKYNDFLNKVKNATETTKKDNTLSISNDKISYQKGIDGFKIDTNNLDKKIIESLKSENKKIDLDGEVIQSDNRLGVIDKKVSTFTTYYNEAQGRATNIRNASKKINGAILYPGDIFSFYKYAGPYGGKGYVYYGNDIGSGVCQVSTTIYNTQLLLNLPIVSRHNHGLMVPYVDYGMDATVYGSTTDFKFKNNTEYPIYIEAITNNGALTISFWSNHDIVKQGYEYKPRVEKIGYLSYKTYIDTYYNGVFQKTTYLNSSFYAKGK